MTAPTAVPTDHPGPPAAPGRPPEGGRPGEADAAARRPQRGVPVGALITLAAVGGVFLTVLLTGHDPGPWWAWFPLTSGLVLAALGLRLHRFDAVAAVVAGRVLLLAGASSATAGVLLLFEVIETGWPAFLVVAGAALAGAAVDRTRRGRRLGGLVDRLLLVWGLGCAALGAVFALWFGAGLDRLGVFSPEEWTGGLVVVLGAHAALEGARTWMSDRMRDVVVSALLLSAGLAAVVHGVALASWPW
ncbi:hypothetical protein [Nocardiopsis trehalosi]|jgi:hypothetical protein|uniref:hypothetical protein n=1 Tax=Nocardiopsis trehalosi TaxID=109329 RepID=UPI0008370E68|nr:hypothetical protein [Nocardiopsis trehalosi]